MTIVEQAKKSIDAVFSDMNVPRDITRDRLIDLRDHINNLIDCLDEDEE